MELRVNDYVRTDTGIIEKLEGIHEQNKTNNTIIKLNKMGGGKYAHILDINSEFTEKFERDFSRGNIIKSSPNIIDLIEVGDYVNGYLVENIRHRYDEEIITMLEVATGSNYFQVPMYEEDIKTIVTKEQFSQMEYKVGD